MSLFYYVTRSFSDTCSGVSFTLQLIWGDAIFARVVAVSFCLSFVARIVLTKLKTTDTLPYSTREAHFANYTNKLKLQIGAT